MYFWMRHDGPWLQRETARSVSQQAREFAKLTLLGVKQNRNRNRNKTKRATRDPGSSIIIDRRQRWHGRASWIHGMAKEEEEEEAKS